MSTGKTTQKIDFVTLRRVRNYGKMGDSFDKALCNLLDELEHREVSNDI